MENYCRYRWQTESITLELDEEYDISNTYEEIIITFQSGTTKIEKILNSERFDLVIDGNQIICPLSQLETSSMYDVKMQVNILFKNGVRGVSDIFNLTYGANLHPEEM